MNGIKISVIIPVYNTERYLEQCLKSVMKQTYQNMEVILVDDGSQDSCPEICDEYVLRDKRCHVIHKENGGLSSARNAGLEKASGDYGIFVDSDDYWMNENGLEQLVRRIKKNRADILNFGYQKYDEDTKAAVPYFSDKTAFDFINGNKKEQLRQLTEKNLFIASACNKLIKMDILKETLFEKNVYSEDVEWCGRLLVKAESFDFMNLTFYSYRQRSESITHSISEKNCSDLKNAIIGCVKISMKASQDIRNSIYRYTAYQLATFIAVQALLGKYQAECVEDLKPYVYILKYYGQNKKVKCMYYGSEIFGFDIWCRIIRSTYKVWGKMR